MRTEKEKKEKEMLTYVKIKERMKVLDKESKDLRDKVEEYIYKEGKGDDEKKIYSLLNGELVFFDDKVKNSGRKLNEMMIERHLKSKGLNPDDFKSYKYDEEKLKKVMSENTLEKFTENPFTRRLTYKILSLK